MEKFREVITQLKEDLELVEDKLAVIIHLEQLKSFNMRNENSNLRLRILVMIISVLPFLFLFAWMIIPELYDSRTLKDRFLEREESTECVGIINDIYRQKNNHNILTLKTKECIYEIHSAWENKFQIGDSISKKEGNLFIEHYRNGTLIEILSVKF